jgi:hypothetical protein
MAGPKTSLEEYAQANHEPRRAGWAERVLPPEVKEQIKEGYAKGIGVSVITDWLKAQGYEGVSRSKVMTFLKLR